MFLYATFTYVARKAKRRAWGSGSISRRPDGKVNLRWWKAGHRRSLKGVLAGPTAKRLLAEKVAQAHSPVAPPAAPTSPTFPTLHAYADPWFSKRQTRANKGDRERYELHLRPLLGHLPPAAITPSLIRDQVVTVKRAQGLGGATVKNMCQVASSMFSDMCEDEVVTYNPWKNLGKKTRVMFRSDYDPKTAPWLSDPRDIPRALDIMRRPYRCFFAVGVMAGLRPGEVRGLDWAHIDWERRKITVCQQANDRLHALTPCKDSASRVVPLLPELEPILREHWLASGSPQTGLVFLPQGPLKRASSKLLFIGIHSVGDEWHRVRVALGLPDMRLYDATRHSFATWWLISGGTRDELKDLLGHSSLATTEMYVHRAKDFGGVQRPLFGIDVAVVRQALTDKSVGLLWRLEGRPEPIDQGEDEEG